MIQLDGCPFCGNKAKIQTIKFRSVESPEVITVISVRCTYCNAEVRVPKDAGENYAAERWNKRTYKDMEVAYPAVVGLLAICKKDLAKIKDISKGFMTMLHSGAENKAKAFEHIANISEYALEQFPLAEYLIAMEKINKEEE